MNIENLKEGMIVKNYKTLCNLLDVEVKGGNSKKAQLLEFERFFSYEKEGVKFKITEIFEDVKEKKNNHGGSRYNVYGDTIQLLILDLLGRENGVVSIGKTKLQKIIGMVNFNFQVGKHNMELLASKLKTNIYTVQDFYSSNGDNFKKAIESSLEDLQDRRIITYDMTLKCRDKHSTAFRDLTNDEREMVLMVEGRLLDQMGYDSISMIRVSPDWEKYRRNCLDIVRSLTNIDYYFDAYKIFINRELAENKKIELIHSIVMDKEESIKTKSKLNDIVMERNEFNAKNRHVKELSNKTYKVHRRDEKYVDDIVMLSNLLISSKCNIDIKQIIFDEGEKPDNKNEVSSEYIEEMLPF